MLLRTISLSQQLNAEISTKKLWAQWAGSNREEKQSRKAGARQPVRRERVAAGGSEKVAGHISHATGPEWITTGQPATLKEPPAAIFSQRVRETDATLMPTKPPRPLGGVGSSPGNEGVTTIEDLSCIEHRHHHD